MRMWCVPTELMCRKHLLGEHVELHMIVGSINKKKNLGKFLNGLVSTDKIIVRHDEIVKEFEKRGYNHRSPLPQFDNPNVGSIFPLEENILELSNRCAECKSLIDDHKNKSRLETQSRV